MSKPKPRLQKSTLLLVGEGYDEEAFLKYLKSELIGRDANLEIKIKNARGKGAKHVIEWTIRQAKNADFDAVGVLLDTDTDWTLTVKKQAKKEKIIILASDPCFEAMLLRLIDVTPEIETKKLKKQFAGYVNDAANVSKNYAKHFNPVVLKNKRDMEIAIDQLLTLLKA
jgi:hypothetical protein